MGLVANILHIPMTESGFNNSRNFELIPDTALIDMSTNYNLHNLGVEERGGTLIVQPAVVMRRVMGGYDFRQSTGAQNMVYAKNDGNIYANNDSNVIATGMSPSNFFHFSQFYDVMYVADGQSTPKKWTGAGLMTPVTPASDWLINAPFQIIFHPRGASFRNWAITKNGVYASAANTGDDFSDANVKLIPVYSKGGLVAAIEFGQELFVFSKTETFRIDDSDPDPTNWGYEKLIFEGGVAHWRLLVIEDNDVYLMTDDLNIYSLQGVFQKGDYRKASIARPAQIDRYLRENATFVNIENWHCAYDPKIRCIKWFIQVGGNSTNTALVQFVDRDPDKMWAFHDNKTYNSGYNVSASFTYRKTTSDWRIRTGDYAGNIWELEELARNDNGNPYKSVLKWKPWEFSNPVMHKYFNKAVLRIRSSTNITLLIHVWVNNIPLPDINLTITGGGYFFDVPPAFFNTATFAADAISKSPFDLKTFGETLQIQIDHNTANEDFFLAEILIAFKELGVKIFA